MLKVSPSTSSFLPQLISFLCLLSLVTATPYSIDRRKIHIDNDPAPPPDEGPPLSASATRDKRLLPYQITGIVGAYIICVATGLTLLCFVGRRLRHLALNPVPEYNPEPIMEAYKTVDSIAAVLETKDIPIEGQMKTWESPTDSDTVHLYPPSSPRSWVKPSGGSSFRTQHSQNGSVVTFDENVIEKDRARAQSEMERLYAAVALHDAEQDRQEQEPEQTTRTPVSIRSPRSENFPVGLPTSPRPYGRNGSMTSLQSPRSENFQSSLQSPRQAQFATPLASPGFAHFAYIQQPLSPNQLSHPLAPTPRQTPLSPPMSPREQPTGKKPGPLSFLRSRGSSEKQDSSFRMSVRGLPISKPLDSPKTNNTLGVVSESEVSDMPLRAYQPGPPPGTPGYSHQRASEISFMPTIPQSAEPSPQPAFMSAPRSSKKTPAPLVLTPVSNSAIQSPSNQKSGSIGGDLPLRSYGPAVPQSAPFTRVQFADRRESKLVAGPKTGVPYPHSPYMPFSPVTPLTATIKTGKELKQMRKLQSKLGQTEMVKSDDEIW